VTEPTPCSKGHRYKPCSCFYEAVRDDNWMRLRSQESFLTRAQQRAIRRRIAGAEAAVERLWKLGS
jgi:hypothetical protein